MVSQPGATFVTLQVRPQPHSLHLDTHLDKLCVSRPDSCLERSGSFTASLYGDKTPSRQGSVKSNSKFDGSSRHDHSQQSTVKIEKKADVTVAKKSSDLNLNNSSKVMSSSKLEDILPVSNLVGPDFEKQNDLLKANPDSLAESGAIGWQKGDNLNTKLPAVDTLSDAGDVFDKSQGRISQLLDSSFE